MKLEKLIYSRKRDWFTILDALIAGTKPTQRQRDKLDKLAEGWITCACGQLCQKLPRLHDDGPLDSRLFHWGGDFNHWVRNAEWKRARATLQQIERRAAKLLK